MSQLSQRQPKKPYCKVCHDSGKSEKEYTNHWVKDLNGKIICPTLLSTECRYCFKLGHTSKFCPALKQKLSKEKEPVKRVEQIKKQINKKEYTKPKNVFACLSDDEDEYEENTSRNSLTTESVKRGSITTGVVTNGWASIVAKKPDIKKDEGPTMVVLNRYTKYEEEPKPEIKKRSWADLSDSEDEDEQYEEEDF